MAAPDFPGTGGILDIIQSYPQPATLYKLKPEWMDFFRDNDFGTYTPVGSDRETSFKDVFYFLDPEDPGYGHIDNHLLANALFAYAYLQRSIVIPGFGWNRLVYVIISVELKERLYSDNPEYRGFIIHSFLKGITPSNLYFGQTPDQEGIIDTSDETADVEIPPPLKEHDDNEVYDLSSTPVTMPYDIHTQLERLFKLNTRIHMRDISTEDLLTMIESGRQVKSTRKR